MHKKTYALGVIHDIVQLKGPCFSGPYELLAELERFLSISAIAGGEATEEMERHGS